LRDSSIADLATAIDTATVYTITFGLALAGVAICPLASARESVTQKVVGTAAAVGFLHAPVKRAAFAVGGLRFFGWGGGGGRMRGRESGRGGDGAFLPSLSIFSLAS